MCVQAAPTPVLGCCKELRTNSWFRRWRSVYCICAGWHICANVERRPIDSNASCPKNDMIHIKVSRVLDQVYLQLSSVRAGTDTAKSVQSLPTICDAITLFTTELFKSLQTHLLELLRMLRSACRALDSSGQVA